MAGRKEVAMLGLLPQRATAMGAIVALLGLGILRRVAFMDVRSSMSVVCQYREEFAGDRLSCS